LTDENPDPKSYARRLVKGGAIIFMALVASGFIAFLLRMFLARSLIAEDIALGVKEGYHYGLFYAILALVSFFALFRDLGLNSALVKYIPEFSMRKKFSAIKSSMAFVAIFQAIFAFSVATLLFIFSNQIALEFFRTEAAVLPLRILCAWFFVMGFYVIIRSAFQGFQNMSAYAGMEFLWITFVLLSAVLFVGVLGQGIGGVASAYLVATAVMIVLALAYFGKRYPQAFKGKGSITKPFVKKLFVFALPVFIGGLGGLVIGYMDTLMIAVFRTLPEVGLYQVAQPTAYILWVFVGALTTVLFPMVSELWVRRERVLLSSALHFLIKFSFMLIIPAALIFIAFPDIIIRLLFGEGYLAGATALQILAGAAIVYTPFAILVSTIGGIGKPIVGTKVIGAMACLNLVGNLLLIPPYGIEGAAVATLFSYLLGFVLLFYYSRKFVKFTVSASSLLKTLAGGVLTLFFIFGLKSVLLLPPWPEAFAVMIPSLVFYGVWILATKAITKDDLKLVARIVPMPKWLVKIARKFVR